MTAVYLIPFITAFCGWLLNSLFGAFVFNKVLPGRQQDIAVSAGAYAAANLSIEKIAGEAASSQLGAVRPEIERHIDVFLNEKLKEKFPMIAMFAGEKTMDKIKEGLLEEIDLLLPSVLQKITTGMDNRLDIGGMVQRKIAGIDQEDFKQALRKAAGGFESRLALWGAFSGFMIGAVALLCGWLMA